MKKYTKLYNNYVRKLASRPKLVITVIVLILLLLIGTSVFLLWPRHTRIISNNTTPTTGVSLIFNPPLTRAVNLEIDDSFGNVVKTYTLTRAKERSRSNFIENPAGNRYSVGLHEGVYTLKLANATNKLSIITKTTTVSRNRLTTENINVVAFP